MAGAVKQLRAANPNTVFAAAGDLIGASTFESFILNDKPTIDALNEAGLDVSSAGNHEFDQGYDDLVDRVMAPTTRRPTRGWRGVGVHRARTCATTSDDTAPLAPTWTQDFGDIKVGFVGAVTEHLPELVSPGGIEEIHVTDVVDEVNAAADDLKTDGADIVVHAGARGCAEDQTAPTIGHLAPDTDFGSIVKGVNDNVDAIVSGHTHLEYNCSFPVPGWGGACRDRAPGRLGRPVRRGLNRIVFTVDTATGDVVAKRQSVLPLKSLRQRGGPHQLPGRRADARTIVDAARGRGRGRWVRCRWARSPVRSSAATSPTGPRRTVA